MRLLLFLRDLSADYRVLASVALVLVIVCLCRATQEVRDELVPEQRNAEWAVEQPGDRLAELRERSGTARSTSREHGPLGGSRDGGPSQSSDTDGKTFIQKHREHPGDFLGDLVRAFEFGHKSGHLQLDPEETALFWKWRERVNPDLLRSGSSLRRLPQDKDSKEDTEDSTEYYEFTIENTNLRGQLGLKKQDSRWCIVAVRRSGQDAESEAPAGGQRDRLLEMMRKLKGA